MEHGQPTRRPAQHMYILNIQILCCVNISCEEETVDMMTIS